MRILLATRTGEVQAEVIRGDLSEVERRLNRAGNAWLTIDRNDPAFREELLIPGARIYAEFDADIPAWGGVLDLPRHWEEGKLRIRAYTIEHLLENVHTPKVRPFYSDLVGSIFIQILQEADQKANLGIDFSNVWRGGGPHWPRYHFRDAMWIINQSIRKMETCDYQFTPRIVDGQIRFRASLQELLGDDKRNRVVLTEGVNVAKARLTEQGTIVNRVAVVGSGSTWGEREVVYGVERESRRRYGFRENVLTPQDVTQTQTLNRYANNAIRESAYPHTLAALTVVDKPPGAFGDYTVGDIVRVVLPTYGFDGYDAPMRVVARGYDPSSGICKLVCDERFEYVPILQGEDDTQPGGAE